jgi:exodeoxyribonuclease VII small subunit
MTEKKFEEAMERLENIVESLEKGDLPLEDSLKIFEEGMNLVSFCSKKLDEAEQKVTMLIKDQSGKYSREAFEAGEKEGD